MSEEKKNTGLRSAVRYGFLTKKEAEIEYAKQVLLSGHTSPDFERWLARR